MCATRGNFEVAFLVCNFVRPSLRLVLQFTLEYAISNPFPLVAQTTICSIYMQSLEQQNDSMEIE